ncbi:MAG: crcB 1 [Microbacteriaceae bacterium]|nr:crcB 1 [Microbacteriaceae bacterium]
MSIPDTPPDRELNSQGPVSRATGAPARPPHLRWRYLGLVALGGVAGTAAREALSLTVPSLGGVPVIILAINVVGAFALGLLLDSLMRRGADEGTRRGVRLLVGTGVLGGFTTYSALATGTSLLFTEGQPAAGIAYSLATVVLGGLATFAGIALATAAHRPRSGPVARKRHG